jgi:hypothetical protein
VATEPVAFHIQEINNYESVIRTLYEKNIAFEQRPLLKDFGGFGTSVHVKIPGSADELDYIDAPLTFVLAVPMSGNFAVETALEFIDLVKKYSGNIPNDLLVAFLGDEKVILEESQLSHKGLRDLISLPDIPYSWVVCYLNLDETPDALVIRHGAGEYIAPLELVKPLPSLFKKHSIPLSFEARYNELYKLGLTVGSTKLALLWEGGINGISFIPAPDTGGKKIEPSELAELLLDYALGIKEAPGNPDRHYIPTFLLGSVFFISEKTAVIFLLASLALLLFGLLYFSAINRIVHISKVRLFFRYSWIFVILLPLMVLIIRGTGLFYAFLHDFFNAPAAGTDFGSSILVILLAGWFFMLLFRLLNLFHFSRKAGFFGVSAIIFATIGLLTAAAMDFTFIGVYLWAFFFAFVGIVTKRPALVFLAAFFVPLRALGILMNLRETGIIPVYFFISQGGARNWFATFQIALLCLPVILLLKRAMTLLSQNDGHILKPSMLIPGLMKISYRNPAARILSRSAHISFLVLMLTFTFLYIFAFSREPERTGLSFSDDADLLSVTLDESVFQESRVVNVSLKSPADPLRFGLFLMSENNEMPLVYSAPVPVERREDNSLMFVLGENPPNPLNLEIVLRIDFRGFFWPEAIF